MKNCKSFFEIYGGQAAFFCVKGAEMLCKGESTAKDVAYETGFTDRKYFCKVFHEVMGESVSEFMKHM